MRKYKLIGKAGGFQIINSNLNMYVIDSDLRNSLHYIYFKNGIIIMVERIIYTIFNNQDIEQIQKSMPKESKEIEEVWNNWMQLKRMDFKFTEQADWLRNAREVM
jgi:hypothetical protein